MSEFKCGPISLDSLRYRLQQELPDNTDAHEGFALVYVEGPQAFVKAHIPMSINIPLGREHEFERIFSMTKQIVVYGDDRSSKASAGVAGRLIQRGFSRIYDFEGGLRAWRDAGGAVESGRLFRSRIQPALKQPIGTLWHAGQAG